MRHINSRKYKTLTLLAIFGIVLLLGYTNCGQPIQNRSVTVGNPIDPDPVEGPPRNQIESGDLNELIANICTHQWYSGFSRNYSRCIEAISQDQALANEITLTTNTFTMQQLLSNSSQLPYSQAFPSCNLALYYDWSSRPDPTTFPLSNYSSAMAIEVLENITSNGSHVCRDIFDYSQL